MRGMTWRRHSFYRARVMQRWGRSPNCTRVTEISTECDPVAPQRCITPASPHESPNQHVLLCCFVNNRVLHLVQPSDSVLWRTCNISFRNNRVMHSVRPSSKLNGCELPPTRCYQCTLKPRQPTDPIAVSSIRCVLTPGPSPQNIKPDLC